MGAHNDVITIVGSFLPCFFQVSFELLDSLVKGSIIIKAFRLEQTLQPRSIVSKKANQKVSEERHALATPVWSPLLGAPSGLSGIEGRFPSVPATQNVDIVINGRKGKRIRQ